MSTHSPRKQTLFSLLRGSAGMTLIEIMVVVAIIGAIGALVVTNVVGYIDESRVELTKTKIRSIESALMQFKRQNGFYPSTEQGLEALVEKPSIGKVPKKFPKDGYLTKLPKDEWDNPFVYYSPGINGNSYEIISYGADGQEGGEDIDADLRSWELE